MGDPPVALGDQVPSRWRTSPELPVPTWGNGQPPARRARHHRAGAQLGQPAVARVAVAQVDEEEAVDPALACQLAVRLLLGRVVLGEPGDGRWPSRSERGLHTGEERRKERIELEEFGLASKDQPHGAGCSAADGTGGAARSPVRSAATARIRAIVTAFIPRPPLKVRDTAPLETPARAATSEMVGRRRGSRPPVTAEVYAADQRDHPHTSTTLRAGPREFRKRSPPAFRVGRHCVDVASLPAIRSFLPVYMGTLRTLPTPRRESPCDGAPPRSALLCGRSQVTSWRYLSARPA